MKKIIQWILGYFKTSKFRDKIFNLLKLILDAIQTHEKPTVKEIEEVLLPEITKSNTETSTATYIVTPNSIGSVDTPGVDPITSTVRLSSDMLTNSEVIEKNPSTSSKFLTLAEAKAMENFRENVLAVGLPIPKPKNKKRKNKQ